MQSKSVGLMPAFARACRAACRASVTPVSPSDTQYRVLIPERWVIHSSEVSMICERSSLVTTRSGTWNPVAMNSVRGIGSLRERGAGRRFRPRAAIGKGVMDLTVSRAQYEAVRGARHLPDVLTKVVDGATRPKGGDRYILHLTYEEATALNELCAWNVHTDAGGGVTPESKVFDDLVKAILTHPDY